MSYNKELITQALIDRMVRYICNRHKFTKQIAEDLVQDTLYKAWLYNNRYDPIYRFSTWLYVILKNNIYDYRKGKKFKRDNMYELNEIIYNKSNGERKIEQYDIDLAINIIRGMRPRYKDPMLLRIDGYDYKEISEKTGLSIGSVKSSIFRARCIIIEKMDMR